MFLAALLGVPFGLPCGIAQEPAGDALARLVAADAAPLVESPDARVRGEAALVLAISGDDRHYRAIADVAADPYDPARLRGIVALGLLATPGCEVVLERLLDDSATRPKPEGVAAAFALAALPQDHAEAAVTRHLTRFLQSSFKRQRDVLLALLAGLQRRRAPAQERALLSILDEPANRDPAVRRALLLVLGDIEGALSLARCRELLDDGTAVERATILDGLARRDVPADLLLVLTKLCQRDPDATVRAGALAVLAHARHLPALELAARAIRAHDPVEVAQATHTALLLGGTGMRRAIERALPGLPPQNRTAVLQAWQGPVGDEFAATCVALASDRAHALAQRLHATLALAQGDRPEALPLLRDLFVECDEPGALRRVARELLRLEETPPELARLTGGKPGDLLQQPDRLAALLDANHPEAARFCLEQLQRTDLTATDLANLLFAFRRSRLQLPPEIEALLR